MELMRDGCDCSNQSDFKHHLNNAREKSTLQYYVSMYNNGHGGNVINGKKKLKLESPFARCLPHVKNEHSLK